MSVAITFDTLKFANRLKAAGASDKLAEAIAEAQAEVQEKSLEELATKRDIRELRLEIDAKLDKELSPIRTDLAVAKWMLGILLAGVLSIVLKMYFPP
ncbi:MAG: DUF1640 domain-containing protein [Magnetococcales bacterium]|nr:DUF1640 domain-containing protein [Magnetococcales bacterium]